MDEKKNLWNLQFFAEEDNNGQDNLQEDGDEDESGQDPKKPDGEKDQDQDKNGEGVNIPVSEMQRRLNSQKKSFEKELDDLKKKYERLNMTEKERKEAEERDRLEELEELRNQVKRNSLEKLAVQKLSELNYVADDELLNLVIQDDEDKTVLAITKLDQLVNKLVTDKVKVALRTSDPLVGGNNQNNDGQFGKKLAEQVKGNLNQEMNPFK